MEEVTSAPHEERWWMLAIDFFWHFQHHTETEFKHHLAQAFAQVAAEARESAINDAVRWTKYYGVVNPSFDDLAEQLATLKSPKKDCP